MNIATKKLFILSAAIFLFGSGYKLGQLGTYDTPHNLVVTNISENAKAKNVDFSLFWEVWDKLNRKYVDHNKLNTQKMYYGAIKGMVASVDDPYTFFLTPDENKLTKDDLGGKFQGIGAQLGLKDGRIVIIAPLKDSPAQKAGVKPGDVISKVDGVSATNWTLAKAVTKIRGEKGTKVTLTLLRNNKEIIAAITRDEIRVDSVELTYEKNAAILKLTKFGDVTNDEWDKAVNTIEAKWKSHQIKGLVLDLRDNPGGYLEGSVYVASEFLSGKKNIVKQQYIDGTGEDHVVSHDGKLIGIPLVILINKGSASASEIVAGALHDYKRAKLVGETSFGKGSIQDALDLSEGAGLHVTIAKWILPNGDWINEKGVKPDIAVENKTSDTETLTRSNDKQLDKALDVIVQSSLR